VLTNASLIHLYNQENGDNTDIVELTKKVGQEKKSIYKVVEWFFIADRSTDEGSVNEKSRRATERVVHRNLREL